MLKQERYAGCARDLSFTVNECNCCCDFSKFTGKKKTQVVYGHVLFGVHRAFPQNNVVYVTLLRNPVERVLS
jgi:hypothetical protein